MNKGSIDILRKVFVLKDLPEDHLQWILERSEYSELKEGDIITKTGLPMDYLFLISEGKLNFYMDVNGKLVHYYTFENNEAKGGVSGLIPYSRMVLSPGFSFAVGDLKMFILHKKYFLELEQLNPELVKKMVGYMTERARSFATLKLQHEKVNALGQLAAGIAHELNNPAAAINRISDELIIRLKQNYELTENLLSEKIDRNIISEVRKMVEEKEVKPKIKLTAKQKIEAEDEFSLILDEIGVPDSRKIIETFIDAGFTKNDISALIGKFNFKKESLIFLLKWLENLVSSRQIITDLYNASSRISVLVNAIKSHVHMDRSGELQPTDIHKDIDNTITLLGYKLRSKNINVIKKYCNDMQDVLAYADGLNQVWTNLIDNSIHAVEKNGTITIETSCNKDNISVSIIDNGAGIPEEIKSRIFDPFFTTKKVGEGTGIGLDLVANIIKRHNGEIKVNSSPGRTEFMVIIPLNQNSIKQK